MHRTDGTGHVDNKFTDGNPATGTPGTKVEKEWLNAVQEELCNLLEGMGVTLVKGTWNQLLGACVAAATAQKIVRRDSAGRAAFADPAAAGDAATKGYVDGKFTTPGWTALPTPDASWTAGTGVNAPSYWKDAAGIVHLKGTITAGASASNLPFANGALPAGRRPASGRSPYFTVPGGTNMGPLSVGLYVNASGGIGFGGGNGAIGSGTLVALDVSFPAEA